MPQETDTEPDCHGPSLARAREALLVWTTRMSSRARLRTLAVLTVAAVMLVMAGPAPVSGQESDMPGRPTNLTGNVAHDSVKLTWDAPDGSSVTGYQVLRLDRAIHALGDFQVHVDDTGTADTSYTDTDVEPEAQYVYRVKARNGDAIGPQSNYFDADLPAPPVPAMPTGLTGTVSANQVALSWDDPQDDTITGYQVLRRDRSKHAAGSFEIHVDDTGTAGTSYTDTDVEAGAEYVYRIKARNAAGLSSQSGYFDANVPETAREPSSVPKQDITTPVTVSFEEASYDVTEGATATVNVVLDKAPGRDLTIELTSDYAGGASDDDVTGTVPTSVSFAGTETEKSFTFTVAADTTDEDGEGITFGFDLSSVTGVTAGDPDETTVNFITAPQVELSFKWYEHRVTEGRSVTITPQLDRVPDRPITVRIRVQHRGQGMTGSDYSGVPGTITFGPSDTQAPFTLTAEDDEVVENHEDLELSFRQLPPRVLTPFPRTTDVRIIDADSPNVTIEPFNIEVLEESSSTFTLELTTQPSDDVTLNMNTVRRGQLSFDRTSLIFTPDNWDTKQTVAIEARADTHAYNGADGLEITGVSDDSNYSGSPLGSSPNVLIRDNDAHIEFDRGDLSVREGEETVITLRLDRPMEVETNIVLKAFPQSGAEESDFSLSPTTLTFMPGDIEKSARFIANQDEVDEPPGERALISADTLHDRLFFPRGDAVSRVFVVIIDDDVGVTFGADSYTAAEGGTTTVSVRLNEAFEEDITVPIVTSDLGGIDEDDYSGVPTEITFPAGTTEQTFTFTATQDTVDDDDESVKLTFGALTAPAVPGSITETTISIIDDDDPEVTVRFEKDSYTVQESDDAQTTETRENRVTVKVILSADPERNVTIPINKYGREEAEADPDADYTDDELDAFASNEDYSGVPANIVFNKGQTVKSFTLTAAHDTVDDDDEMLRLSFINLPTRVTEASSDEETVITIADDDDPPVLVGYKQAVYSVAESDNTSTNGVQENKVTVTVELDVDPERTIEIPITAAGQNGATDDDYSGVPEELVFNSGETVKTFVFMARHDTEDDDDETVLLGFDTSDLPDNVAVGDNPTATVTIVDDDDPTVTVRFEQSAYTVAESDDANTTDVEENKVEVKVILSADPERRVTIELDPINQGGAGDGDYSGVPQSLVFNAGETVKSFTFTAVHDTVDDDGESVRLTFVNLPDMVTEADTNSEAVVHITDDDKPTSLTVNFEQDSYTVAEGDSVTVTVTLSDDPEMDVTIPILRTNLGGATDQDNADPDYSGVPDEVVFAKGQTERTFTFTAVNDTVDDDDESVRVAFGSLPNGSFAM